MKNLPLSHVTIHGHDVSYRRGGEGETVLLLHGLAGSSRTWRAVLPELARTHDVIAPDLLGHGESAKPMGDYSLGAFASGLRDFLAALDVPQRDDRRALLRRWRGHATGLPAPRALRSAGAGEQRRTGARGELAAAPPHPARCRAADAADVSAIGRRPRQRRRPGCSVGIGLRSPHLAEMWRAYASLAGAENRRAFVRTIRGVIEPGGQTVSALDRLYLAAHLAHADRVGQQATTSSRSNMPPPPTRRSLEAALAMLAGVGHFPHIEAPDRFLSVLIDFLGSTTAGQTDAVRLHDILRSRDRAS